MSTIQTSLRPFHALLRIPNDASIPIKIYHKSFPDYILDQNRCPNPQIHINSVTYDRMLAEDCLRLMNGTLKKNICSLPRYAMNQDLDLEERRRRVGGALEYACSFWADHLFVAEILPSHKYFWWALEEFLTHRQVLWFEVLSLVEILPVAIYSLSNAHDRLASIAKRFPETAGHILELSKWITDGQRFILEFRECIKLSATHLYHSALPLSPNKSLLRISHSQDLESEVRVLHGNEDEWPPSHLTINYDCHDSYHEPSSGLQFLNRSEVLAFWGYHCFKLVSVKTGQPLLTLKSGWRPTIAISPDDTLLVHACDGEHPRLFDLQTGVLIRDLEDSSVSPCDVYRAAHAW